MANKPQSGKGSGRRQEDFLIVQNNWDEIPNFGYKPRWMKELKPLSDKKSNDITRPLNEKKQEKM